MSSAATNSSKEKSLIFETLLSSPGMNEKCKIVFALSRQNILLFCRLIEAGLLSENGGFHDEVLNALSKDLLEEFRTVHEEILRKADLTEFYQKLKLLQ